jgi:hypothetical protein
MTKHKNLVRGRRVDAASGETMELLKLAVAVTLG